MAREGKKKRYLVDGSNVLFRLFSPRSEQEAAAGRRKVARLCASLAAREKAWVALYFDGEDRCDLKDFYDRGVWVSYSGRRSADALIVYALKKRADPSETCVITDDGALARRATKVGAVVWPTELLLGGPRRPPRREPPLSRGEMEFLERTFTRSRQ